MFSGGQSSVDGRRLSELGARDGNGKKLNGACSTAGEGEAEEIEYRWPLDTRLYCSLGLLPFFHAIEAVIGPRNGF